MITDAQYAAWLESSGAQRVTLIEVGVSSAGVNQVRYLSNKSYLNGSAATPYLAVVTGGLKLTESISLTAAPTLTAGDLELDNTDGSLDSWLDDVWKNQRIRVYVGDVRWARADFRQIFEGAVKDIDCAARDKINLVIANKMELLNTAISEVTLGGAGTNAANLLPVLVGEVHNQTPMQTNAATLEYACHVRAMKKVFEVRDLAKPVSVAKHNDTGRFNLLAKPTGTITCSVQGDAPGGIYTNRIAPLIRRFITDFGSAAVGLSEADIDETNFAAFDLANPQPVGKLLGDRANVAQTCQSLAGSVGAQLLPSRAGLFRLVQLTFPTTASTEIPPSAQINKTIEVSARSDVVAGVKIAYNKNYTVQTGLLTSIPPEDKVLFGQEWLVKSADDPLTKALYKITDEPVQQETDLQVGVDAQAEANRRLQVFKRVRTTYRFEGTPINVLLELGQAVKLYSERFGLASGKVGLVTGLATDLFNLHTTVEVTI